ncbi:MAG: glycerophosphodiester phosphodiesterase [Gammaproteobacteria bacterium]|nr:glycerophosphodiester phosphodiesterase [Gammaproteobacteria bacterium]
MASTLIQGHRGARGLAPENSLPAFARAFSIGVDAVELDVGVSADGVVVVAHDRELNPDIARRADGTPLSEPTPTLHGLTLEQIKSFTIGRLRPGSVSARRFAEQDQLDGVTIPTLEEVVALAQAAADERVHFNIEIKTSPEQPQQTLPPERFAEVVVDEIRRLRIARRTWIQAFDWRVLQHVQRIAAEIPTGYLSAAQSWFDTVRAADPRPSPWTAGFTVREFGTLPRMVMAAGGTMWCPYYEDVEPACIAEAHALGLRVFVWTVNGPADMRRLIEWSIDGVISDYPDRLRTVAIEMGRPVPPPARSRR